MLSRSLMGAGGEVLVAASSASSAGDDNGVAGASEVVYEFAGSVVVKHCADGNFEYGVFASLAGAVRAQAVAAAFGLVFRVEAEMDEGVVGERRGHQDVASMTTITTRRTATGNELLAPEGHTTVAAVSGLNSNSCFVNKHFSLCSVLADAVELGFTSKDNCGARTLSSGAAATPTYWRVISIA